MLTQNDYANLLRSVEMTLAELRKKKADGFDKKIIDLEFETFYYLRAKIRYLQDEAMSINRPLIQNH